MFRWNVLDCEACPCWSSAVYLFRGALSVVKCIMCGMDICRLPMVHTCQPKVVFGQGLGFAA